MKFKNSLVMFSRSFKISARLQINVFVLKKKALCDVFMLSDVQCTFTVNLYKGNSINLIFSYDN